MNYGLGVYPDILAPDFYEQITRKKEFLDNKLDSDSDGFSCLLKYQKFLRNFMSILTNYNGLLINHYTGLGKTLSAISIAEGLKSRYDILIISKNDILLNNFKQEITGKCTNYISTEQLNTLNDPEVDPEEKSKIYKEINKAVNKHYSFFKYTDVKPETRLDNKLVIIDEVHNITGNSFYGNILECLKNSKNTKLVLLSATPTFDKCFEIFYIINLLNVVDNLELLPDKVSEMTKKGLIKNTRLNVKNTDFITKTESLYELTEVGEEIIKSTTKGKVSFLLPDTEHFAKKKFNGQNVIENNVNSFIVFKSNMTTFQKTIYNKKLKEPGVLYKNASDASTMVYPDSSTGETGYVKFIKDQKVKDFLKLETIKKYSCKLYNLVKLIKESQGIVFIFSNYVNNGGTNLIRQVLRENGYSNYSARNDKPKYYFFNESTSVVVKNKISKVLNDPSNRDGSKLKIIIGSPFISEGITFKNTRQIHILEPYWNFSRIDQVIGRGLRFKSHEDLPTKDRVLDIYLHVAVGDNIENSIDVYKYKICQFKDIHNKKVEYILKKNSIDCFLNKSRNMLTDLFDYTRECQYKKCEYVCPFEMDIQQQDTDLTTFELEIHAMDEFDFIKKNILNIFKEINICDVNYIIKYIKDQEESSYSKNTINKKNIYYVLDKIIQDSEIFMNNKNMECYLLKINKYYIANPKDNPVSESFYNKLFVKQS